MLIKIDLEKVFDKLEWSFIYRTLLYFKYPSKMSKLIMSCITTTSTAVLVNGTRTNFFYPSREIRQGDPISPYIFILCMEMLSKYINHQVDIRKWDSINLGYNCPPLSHLFFADDLVLIGKAKAKTSFTIQKALKHFCKILGQSINYKKSRIIFSKNCNSTTDVWL